VRRIGATILSLVFAIGLLSAAQPAAPNAPSGGGIFSSLLRSLDGDASDRAPSLFRPLNPGDTLHVDVDVYNDAVGLTSGGTFYSAVRLTAPKACTVETIIWYRWNACGDNYLFVWAGNTQTLPGAVIESVPYSAPDSGWQTTVLLTPVPLDSGDDIWIGPRMTHSAGTFPLGVDDGPYVATRGDWVNMTGTWEELSVYSMSYNWHIRAILGHAPAFATDVGCQKILAPLTQMVPGSVAPKLKIRNYGSAPQAGFMVKCLIDSAATRVYEDSFSWTDTLQPGASDSVTFATWTTGQHAVYDVTMFTDLPTDSNRANDTLTQVTLVSMTTIVWAELSPDPTLGRYWSPGTGSLRDTLWFLGGRMSAQVSTRSMTAYDIANDSWITSGLPTLTTPRRAGGGGQVGNKIYLAGGKDSASTLLTTCEEFDLDTKTSTAKASMPAAEWAVASAVAGGKLYIIGNESQLGTTYEYNPATDSWKTKANLSVGRGWACAAGANGLVYVMGGSGTSTFSDCWCFNPTANTWTQKANMPGPRIYSLATAYKDSVIYVIGGSTDGTVAADKLVYAYDIASNRWKTETPKPTASGWHMVNVVGDAIYVAYGSDCTTPTYLTNLDVGWPPLYGIDAPSVTQPKEACRITPSVVRDFACISYSVARTGRAELGIYDVTGKLVRTLVNGTVKPGNQNVTWNRTDNGGRRVANGTYFYRLTVDGKSVSGKAIALK
jgi:N-acetylneuraminic acid mutarotase